MRGLKSLDTAQALLDGWLVHYNFYRDHESLDGKTPAQAAGVKFPYRDWLQMVEGQRPPAPKLGEGEYSWNRVSRYYVDKKLNRNNKNKKRGSSSPPSIGKVR